MVMGSIISQQVVVQTNLFDVVKEQKIDRHSIGHTAGGLSRAPGMVSCLHNATLLLLLCQNESCHTTCISKSCFLS
jgi:hypothetical protein